jgi:HK97 family phage prohead protease
LIFFIKVKLNSLDIKQSSQEKKNFNCSFELKNLDSNQDPEFHIFEGYASTYGNVDLGDDIIMEGAFTESLKQDPNVNILWQHKMSEPIGTSVMLFEDNIGLYVKAKLPKDDDLVRGRVMPQMKAGSIKEMSIGFIIEDYQIEGEIRKILKVKLFEISLVTKAMNPKALVTGFKAVSPDRDLPIAPRDTAWDSTAAISRIRDFTNSEESPSEEYRRYFMFYDADNADKFSAYKLPFVDIIDGEPHLIPRAIFAIAASLAGARGGVEIPEADRDRIISIINNAYTRMAREFDDNSIQSPLMKNDTTGLTYKAAEEVPADIKEVEKYLKSKGLSQKDSKTIISRIKDVMKQRDVANQKTLRDGEVKKLTSEINNLTKYLKGNK